jgi:acetyl esterase/lipase
MNPMTRFDLRWLAGCGATIALAGWLALPGVAAEPERQPAAAGPAAASDPAAVPPALGAVTTKRNIPYYDGADADPVKHKLDLFLPAEAKDFPVVLFVHGGAWMIGDKADFGIYAALGRMLASQGIGAVMTNYRLSPQVKHPEHIKDVARAFAWTQQHIAEYGGRSDQLFVSGHSAGGHLVALLATDESWLKAEGRSLKDIRGAVPISGVYRIPPGMFNSVFGTDPAARRAAEPTQQAGAGSPPFLIVYADRDFPFCDVMSEKFCRALSAQGVAAETLAVASRNHISIVLNAARNTDPCGEAIRDFVRKHLD